MVFKPYRAPHALRRPRDRRAKEARRDHCGRREPSAVRADFLVEGRGFEPMAIAGAGRSRAIPHFASQGGATKDTCSARSWLRSKRPVTESTANVHDEGSHRRPTPGVTTRIGAWQIFGDAVSRRSLATLPANSRWRRLSRQTTRPKRCLRSRKNAIQGLEVDNSQSIARRSETMRCFLV